MHMTKLLATAAAVIIFCGFTSRLPPRRPR